MPLASRFHNSGLSTFRSAHVHTHSLGPDLTAVPIEGVEPSHAVLATRARGRNRLVAAFRT